MRMELPRRPHKGRLLGGVCAALADRLLIDVTLLRLVVILLTLAWGVGLLLYAALWLLLPDADHTGATSFGATARRNWHGLRYDLRRSRRRFGSSWAELGNRPWPRPLDRRWAALALVAAGAGVFLASIGAFSWLTATRALGLALIALGAAALLTMRG